MKIKTVEYKNCRNVPDMSVDIQGKNILLVGDNGVGKSNAIKFILSALGLMNPGKDPIKIGELAGHAQVIADKDGNEYKFMLKMKAGKDPVVECVFPDGVKETRKSMLGQVTGVELPFDIDKFVQMSSSAAGRRQQVEIVKTFFPENVRKQLAEMEAKVQKAYDERTEIGRQQKMYKTKVDNNTLTLDQIAKFAKPIDVSALNEEYRKIIEYNAEIDKQIEANKALENRQTHITEEIEQAKAMYQRVVKDRSDRIAEHERQIAILKQDVIDSEKETEKVIAYFTKEAKSINFNNPPDPKDPQPVLDKLNTVTEHNEMHSKVKQLNEDIKLRDDLEVQIGEMTVFIDTSREAIRDAIRDIGLPVDGLTFDNEQLYWNDRPVDEENLSTSEIMELGIRLRIARNPEFGVLLLERGESIGKQRWKEIQDLCKKYNWHIIAEKVDSEVDKLTVVMMKEI